MMVIYGMAPNTRTVVGLKRCEAFNLLAFCKKAYDFNTDAKDLQQTYASLSVRPMPTKMVKALDQVMTDIATEPPLEDMRRGFRIATRQIRAL